MPEYSYGNEVDSRYYNWNSVKRSVQGLISYRLAYRADSSPASFSLLSSTRNDLYCGNTKPPRQTK